MAAADRLLSLARRHADLEERIRAAGLPPGAREAEVKGLKLRKLRLKEEMGRLARDGTDSRDDAPSSPAVGDGTARPPPDGTPAGALRRRHAELDEGIRAAYRRPFVDEAELRRMKLEKLRLKEALEGIAAPPAAVPSAP